MAEVTVELRVPDELVDREQVDVAAIGVDSIPGLDAPTGEVVTVRRTRQGPVALVRGTSRDPHALSRHPRVVSVWDAAGRPMWDHPAAERDASRYAL
jgi:hypothetical protein